MKSLHLIKLFFNTPFVYTDKGLAGFNYDALKDALRWGGLKPREYMPIMLSCMNLYIKGINSKT